MFLPKSAKYGIERVNFNNFDKCDKRKICLSQFTNLMVFFTPAHFNGVEIFLSLSSVVRAGISGLAQITARLKMKNIV